MCKEAGFTLLEVLVALSVAVFAISIAVPVSYDLYMSYKNSLKVQEVALFISALKRESFLYGKETQIDSSNGYLLVDGEKKSFPGIYLVTEQPIRITKNGTTSGGEILMKMEKETYVLKISPPFSDLVLTRAPK